MEICKPIHIDFEDLCRICLDYQAETPHCNIFESRIEDPDLDEKDTNLLLCEALQSITSIAVSISGNYYRSSISRIGDPYCLPTTFQEDPTNGFCFTKKSLQPLKIIFRFFEVSAIALLQIVAS